MRRMRSMAVEKLILPRFSAGECTMTKLNNIDREFERLVSEVRECRSCPRMAGSSRILGRSAGLLDARLMFVGEAPGRLGADDTHVPFHGDRAGENFERLLQQANLDRYGVFVTNAVLCNPRDDKGNNAPPNRNEISNCSGYLRRQIELVNPDIVVTLGATALEAVRAIESHSLSINSNVRSSHAWFGRQLIPLYHPGQRALLHRSFANQLADYQFVSEKLNRLNKRTAPIKGEAPREALAVVDEILRTTPDLSYFALHKLFFLVEYTYFLAHSKRLTGSYIIRQKDGPYCVDLHWRKLTNALPGLRVETKQAKMYLHRNASLDLYPGQWELSEEARSIIHRVTSSYGALDDARLKTAVYLTSAMRGMLKRERNEGINLFNAPIPFELQAG